MKATATTQESKMGLKLDLVSDYNCVAILLHGKKPYDLRETGIRIPVKVGHNEVTLKKKLKRYIGFRWEIRPVLNVSL